MNAISELLFIWVSVLPSVAWSSASYTVRSIDVSGSNKLEKAVCLFEDPCLGV